MDQNWPSQGFYNYYPPEARGSTGGGGGGPPGGDRSNHSPPQNEPNHVNGEGDQPLRRGGGGGGYNQPNHPTFLPLPPPHHAGHGGGHPHPNSLNLPPFASTFYSGGFHSPPAHPTSNSAPSTLHLGHGMPGPPGGYVPMGAPNQYHYPMTSPASMSSGSMGRPPPPPHAYSDSPRMPGGGGYSSSPNTRHLSPISPTTHLAPPGVSNSGSTSSSGYPSVIRTPNMLPKAPGGNKRRSGSPTQSESWDEADPGSSGGGGRGGMRLEEGEEEGEQPWGMPQDEYKALNPKDKKQVRNRIGARRFRAKRKDYVSNLESTLRSREDECGLLRSQVEAQRVEINDLRHRLGMPLLAVPDSGLGLVVGATTTSGAGQGWHDGPTNMKEDRKGD